MGLLGSVMCSHISPNTSTYSIMRVTLRIRTESKIQNKGGSPPSTLTNSVAHTSLLAFILVPLGFVFSIKRQEPSIYKTVKRPHTNRQLKRRRGGEINGSLPATLWGSSCSPQWPRCEKLSFSCKTGHPDLPCHPLSSQWWASRTRLAERHEDTSRTWLSVRQTRRRRIGSG